MIKINKSKIIIEEREAHIYVRPEKPEHEFFEMCIGGYVADEMKRKVQFHAGAYATLVEDSLEAVLAYASEHQTLTPLIIKAISEAYDYVTIDDRTIM